MARDGDFVGGVTGRREQGGAPPQPTRDVAPFGRLHGGPLNQWKVEERRG